MKKKVIKASLLTIFLVLLTIFGVFNLVRNISNAEEGSTSTSAKPGTLMAGENNPSTYSYKTNFGTWIYENYTYQPTWYVPRYDGYQVYCISPDDHIQYAWEITWDELALANAEMANPRENTHGHATTYSYHKTRKTHTANGYGVAHDSIFGKETGSRSNNFRTPIKWTPTSTTDLTHAMAYVVSDETLGAYTDEKQLAIWKLGIADGTIAESTKGKTDGTSTLQGEANNYSKYHSKVEAKSGLDPKDFTNIDGIATKIDQTSSKYTVGPYKITYTNGTYGGITFGGISDVKIIGYNKNKVKVKEFNVEQFVIDGKEITPEYFEPSANLKVDETEQKYPKSGKNFDIIFSNPNSGLDVNDPKRIAYISLRVEFKYMLAYGKRTDYDGQKKILNYHESHPSGTHNHYYYKPVYDSDGKQTGTTLDRIVYGCPYKCKKWHDNSDTPVQPLMVADAIRSIYEQELEVGKDTPVDITMDIAGKVWEDEKSGKETLADGERGEDEAPVNGIPVILYDDEGKEVARKETGEEEGKGEYKFEQLDAMRKYYVEFQYNGQQYENTLYNNKLDDKHSIATETTTDRDDFNKKFEEIDGDEGYELKALTYKDGERATYYNKPGIFTISAFTGNDGKDDLVKYPESDVFVLEEVETTVAGKKYKAVYDDEDSIKHMDFGITQRIEFDMALKKDLYTATVKINGKTEVYGYDKKLANVEDGQKANSDAGYAQWTINVVDGGYERGLDDADWKFNGKNGNKDGLLEVYATYKVAVRNQSMSMLGHVTKLYDYYDSTYEYIPDLSWQSTKNVKTDSKTLDYLQNIMEKGLIPEGNDEKLGEITRPKILSNENETLTIDVNKKQKTGETQYLYLTFKIKGEGGNEIGEGVRKNYAEIGAFKTYYKGGKTTLPHYNGENSYKVTDDNMIAGRVDRDSMPSSMGKGKEPNERNDLGYPEDDEDKAPGLNVKNIKSTRKLNGTVWEDERNINSGNAMIGDGIMGNNETKIAGVQVDLVEKTVWNEQKPTGEYVWKTTYTDQNGKYSFDGYIPGDYVIRFTYGESLSGTDKNDGKSYNGQDYKSTTYQAGITQTETTDLDGKYKGYNDVNNQNETGTYGYNIATKKENVSDAKDIWSIRETDENAVNQYSRNGVTNRIAEILASPYQTPSYNGTPYTTAEMNKLLNEFMNKTTMTAESGVVVVEVERNMQSNLENGNPSYKLENLNLGLVERPKAQLEIDKSITNIKVTLANSTVLFDVNKAGDNVIWKDHTEYNLASHKKNNKYEEYYGKRGKNRYSYREEVDNIVRNADKGLVQLTMDEELMHGATIEITYQVKVTNVGEVDYTEKEFYYTGTGGSNIVTTQANTVVDYVANNLQFNKNDSRNTGWSVVTKDVLTTQKLVNSKLTDQISKFNTIIETTGLDEKLRPGMSTTKTLVLSQLITAENKSDDLTYSNMVEIVKTSNTVGRRMAYSVVGNQDPTASKAAEVDASIAEKVIILPPFGEKHIFYILGAVIGIILIGGITFIIRKVLKK